MGTSEEADGLMKEHSKRDITTALVLAREATRTYRTSLFELTDALGLLPESASHSEAIKRANDLCEMEREHQRLLLTIGRDAGDHDTPA